MEVLTKTGLTALWQKLKNSFILKKGGGTIVNNGDDNSRWKDYKLGINHTGFGLRDDLDRFRIRLSPDEVELKYNTNDGGTTITDNTIVMPGITLTGDKDDGNYRSSIRVGSVGANEYTYINRDGIESYNGTNKEVYTRDGNYVNIGDLPGNLVALDNNGKLPSAVGNFVPLDKASTIYVKNDNETKIDIGSKVTITGKRKETDDYAYSNIYDYNLIRQNINFKGVNTDTLILLAQNIALKSTQYNLSSYYYTNNIGASYILMYNNIYSSYVDIQPDNLPRIRLYKRNPNYSVYLRPTGLLFELNGKKVGDLVGANSDFYYFNAANGVPQLDANGKLDSSVLPSSLISDVLVNGTSVVSDGVANITPENLLNKTFDTTINDLHFGYSSDGLYADQIFTGYKWNTFNLLTAKLESIKVSDSLVTSRLSLLKQSMTSGVSTGDTTIVLDSSNGLIKCDGIAINSNDKKGDTFVFNTNGGIINLNNRYLPLSGGTIYGDVSIGSTLDLGLGLLKLGTLYGACGLQMGNMDYDASGEELANLKIHSWNGISFTTTTSSAPFYNKTAVGIDCRSGNLYVGNNITATGTISGSSTSDIRLKDNLKEADCISTINSLGDVYSFTYKDTKEDSIGLIALNVRESSLADLVTENSEGYLGINYWSPKLVCLALGAAQLLDKRVKELEKQIEELKSK